MVTSELSGIGKIWFDEKIQKWKSVETNKIISIGAFENFGIMFNIFCQEVISVFKKYFNWILK